MEAKAIGAIRSECERVLEHIESASPGMPLGPADSVAGIRGLLGGPPDFVVQAIGPGAHLLYLRTIVDQDRLDQAVLELARAGPPQGREPAPGALAADYAAVGTWGEAAAALLAAHVVLIRDGRARGVAIPLATWPKRDMSEPKSEIVTQGPHAGFIEDLNTNVAMLRHRIPEPSLRWEALRIGRRSRIDGAMLFLDGVARRETVARVRRHLRRARPSFATDSSMLDQWISFHSGFLFPTIGKTERPDTASAALLGGRVAILVEGSPVALLLPNVFADLIHSPDDYYNRPYSALVRRGLRLLGTFVALTASPVFVALVTVNRELLPTPLFISIAQARAGVPLGALPEVLLLEMMVEVIREAGLHLPGTLGQTISIVGAVVIGQSAVIAGLISAPSVVVVSVAFLCSFILPSSDATLALRYLRYPLILLAAGFGVLGIAWGIAVLLAYLCALSSFGVPYLAPFSPLRPAGLQDALWRRPGPWLQRSFVARRARGRRRAP